MSNAAALAALEYEPEAAFAENVSTFTAHRIPTATAIDVSGLKHDKVDSGRVVQRLQDGSPSILGVQGGTIKVKIHAAGHGSSCAGATTLDAIETFLALCLGNATVSAATGTTAAGGGTATIPITVASGSFSPGSLCRIGTAGNGGTVAADGRGNGQFAAIATHITTNLTLLTAIDAAPSAADVIYSAVNLYLPEDATDATATITGIRLRFLSANLLYEMHGCVCTDFTLSSTDPGQLPYYELTFTVSRWLVTATGTYPSVVASNQYNPAPITQGSLFVNTVGTATRAKRVFRHFSVTIKLGVQLLMGPGGVGQYQSVIGAKRTPSKITVKWTEDADAAPTATPSAEALFLSTNKLHLLVTFSANDGSALGIYFPNLCVTGARPVQTANENINRMSVEATAYTGGTTTSQLTMSAMRIAHA